MPPVASVSPVTGDPVPESYIHSSSLHFQDVHGRSLLLRGVNLSGSAKAPHGQPSYTQKGFWEEADAGKGDFVGRTLNLEDGSADVHLARLKAWGFNMIRYVFTWESLEHEGPGKYDYEYMEYIMQVLKKCKDWGFRVFMDPHQDVWSRFSGGSGAPIWTIYACGMDPLNITPTFSALLHNEWPDRENPRPKDFPQMIWSTNYTRLFSQTVWTLFFAGKAFAPKCIIDGKNIQDWLQDHFIDAYGALAKRIQEEGDLLEDVVIGWDSVNEPGDGLIGYADLGVIPREQRLKKGPTPTPFQGMQLGMGGSVECDDWTFTAMGPKLAGRVTLDSKGTKLWLKPEEEATRGGGKWGWQRDESWELGTCIWAQHGVWDPSTNKLLKPNYFRCDPAEPSKPVSMVNDFWPAYWVAHATKVRRYHPEAIHFVQAPVFAIPPPLSEELTKGRMATSPHYYDGLTLMLKHWNWFNADALGLLRGKYWTVVQALKIGEPAIRKCIQDQLGILQKDTKDVYGDYPTLIGEIGCPFDLDDKKAYGYVDGGKGEGDYTAQTKAWDASMNAADGPNCLNYTLWTYVVDNTHEWGDNWNGEDLSIWSADDARKTEAWHESKQPTGSATMQAAPSSASSSVTGQSSAPSLSSTLVSGSKKFTPSGITSGDGVSSALILEGSRAVGAIVRPYPHAMVGTPIRLDFERETATFKLSVRVSSKDKSSESISTEIFLPFVHYAASLQPYSSSSVPSHSGTNLLAPSSGSATPTDKNETGQLKLAIIVQLSHGSYETKGQMLYWKYPVPTSGEETYSIEVKRIGGAMTRELGYVQQGGGWGDVMELARRFGADW